jgi:hypothetical protein
VRPVREQLEHDRIIRLLQAKYRRKFRVEINPGDERTAGVKVGALTLYPDLVLSDDGGRKPYAVVEVETSESVNHLEAMSQWANLAKSKSYLYLYVPIASVDTAKRLCADHDISLTELVSYMVIGDQVRFTTVSKVTTPEPLPLKPQPAEKKTAEKKPAEATAETVPTPIEVAAEVPAPRAEAEKRVERRPAEKPATEPARAIKAVKAIAKKGASERKGAPPKASAKGKAPARQAAPAKRRASEPGPRRAPSAPAAKRPVKRAAASRTTARGATKRAPARPAKRAPTRTKPAQKRK